MTPHPLEGSLLLILATKKCVNVMCEPHEAVYTSHTYLYIYSRKPTGEATGSH